MKVYVSFSGKVRGKRSLGGAAARLNACCSTILAKVQIQLFLCLTFIIMHYRTQKEWETEVLQRYPHDLFFKLHQQLEIDHSCTRTPHLYAFFCSLLFSA